MAPNRILAILFTATLALTAVSGCLTDGDAEPASTVATTTSAAPTNTTATTAAVNTTSAPVEPPIAKFTVSPANASETNLSAGSELVFDASESSDPAGGNLSYSWNFGDSGTADGVVVRHVYAEGGNFTVTLGVTSDASQLMVSTSQTLVVPGSAVEPRVWEGITTGSAVAGLCLPDAYTYFDPEIYAGWTYKIEPAGFTTEWWVENDTLVEEGKSSGTVPEKADNVGGCSGGPVAVDSAYKITVVPPGYKA